MRIDAHIIDDNIDIVLISNPYIKRNVSLVTKM